MKLRTQRVVAVLGLSGVGKTTLLHKLADRLPFQHLHASALIQEGRRAHGAQDASIDMLRMANIDENQKLLIAGFEKVVDRQVKLVVVDGHSVIDTPEGLVRIQSAIFAAIEICQVVCLVAEPFEIEARRLSDAKRKRPARSAKELEEQQNTSIVHALRISLDLSVPMHVFTSTQIDEMQGILTA
jgi:adenylate kinase